MELHKMSLTELKALGYDIGVSYNMLLRDIQEVQNMILKRQEERKNTEQLLKNLAEYTSITETTVPDSTETEVIPT